MTHTLRHWHQTHGADVADDGIPRQYTDLLTEYRAALDHAILLDRSHEARIRLTGADRADLLQRISTNDVLNLAPGEGRPTLFTNSNARLLDRVLVYHTPADALTLFGGPGRGAPLLDYLRRNIFFRDQVKAESLNETTAQFSLHGPAADEVAAALDPRTVDLAPLHGIETTLAGVRVFLARRKPYSGTHWVVLAPLDLAAAVWEAILTAGQPHGLTAAGSLTFNTLRIRAGRPGVGRELSPDYLPLELGLWDEVNFHKGCYTGQEIIARMESRNRLAKTIVRLMLPAPVNSPVDLLDEGKRVGVLTSSVTAPDGEHFGIGVVRPLLARVGQTLMADGVMVTVVELPGVQPPVLEETGEA